MKLYLGITLYLAIFCTIGCKKESDTVFFSFGEVGNEWTYEYISIEPTSQVTTIDTIKYSIIDKQTDNLYTVKYSYPSQDITTTWYFSNNEFGYYESGQQPTTKILIKNDAKVGDSYYSGFSVEGVQEKIYVLGDSLLCFKVNTLADLAPDYHYLWINNKYGIVKESSQSVGMFSNNSTKKLINKNF